ncbi:alpha/beta fold hydrolase [Streptomyces natalensis]|uniref:alpha/beta fold hydrolase n=1 Tax=Streptomyces natalensis TaxID=68242 RepID=UPI00068F9AFD
MHAIREYPDGWGLAVRPKDMVASQQLLNGDHWDEWLSSDGPALLIHGARSEVLSSPCARAMAERRPRTRIVELATGHTVHESDPAGFAAAVRNFLGAL